MNAFLKQPFKIALVLGFIFMLQADFLPAQTKIIGHKSHSGQASEFDVSGGDGYGLPSKRILKIEKLADSAIVFHHAYSFWANDTMINHPLLRKKAERIREMYGDQVELIGFDKPCKKKKNSFYLIVPGGPHLPALPILVSFLCGMICLTGFWLYYRKSLLHIPALQ